MSTRTLTPFIAATAACVMLTGSAVNPSLPRLDLARETVAAAQASPRVVTIEVSLVAAIIESPTTIGVADSNLYTLSAVDLERQLTLLKAAGVTDLRVGVPWVYVQPSANTYDWSKMDALVNTAEEMGFSITASITGNTTWSGGVPLAGAPNKEAYANFAGVVADRYKGKISAYEVWNEPNGVIFYAPVSPESYTDLLKVAHDAIKEADPDAKVVGGVLGAVKTIPGTALAPQEFLSRMYAAGAGGYFDALSYHPYHYTTPFSQGAGITDSPLEQYTALRALMDANGDEALKIWATEYGTPTTPFFGLSEQQQAAFMRDFIAAWQSVDGAGPAFLYTARDLETGMWDNESNFGLFHTNWSPKEMVAVLTEIQAQLDAGTFDDTYRFGGISNAQGVFIQVASLVLGFTNLALSPVRALFNGVSALGRQVFDAVATAVRDTIRTIGGVVSPRASVEAGEMGTRSAAMTVGVEDRVTGAEESSVGGDYAKGDILTSKSSAEKSAPADTPEESPAEAATPIPQDVVAGKPAPEVAGTAGKYDIADTTEKSSAVDAVSAADAAEKPESSAAEAPSDKATEKAAAKETAKAEKAAEREAKREAKAAAKAEKAAAKAAAKAEKAAAKEAAKAEKAAAKEAAKAEKAAAKDAKKSESKSDASE